MITNKFLATGAILSALILPLHIFGGGPEFPEIIFAIDALDAKQKALYGVMWHTISALLFLASITYGIASIKPQHTSAVTFVNALYAAITVLFLYYGITVVGDLWTLPQWLLFAIMIAITQMGLIRKTRRN